MTSGLQNEGQLRLLDGREVLKNNIYCEDDMAQVKEVKEDERQSSENLDLLQTRLKHLRELEPDSLGRITKIEYKNDEAQFFPVAALLEIVMQIKRSDSYARFTQSGKSFVNSCKGYLDSIKELQDKLRHWSEDDDDIVEESPEKLVEHINDFLERLPQMYSDVMDDLFKKTFINVWRIHIRKVEEQINESKKKIGVVKTKEKEALAKENIRDLDIHKKLLLAEYAIYERISGQDSKIDIAQSMNANELRQQIIQLQIVDGRINKLLPTLVKIAKFQEQIAVVGIGAESEKQRKGYIEMLRENLNIFLRDAQVAYNNVAAFRGYVDDNMLQVNLRIEGDDKQIKMWGDYAV